MIHNSSIFRWIPTLSIIAFTGLYLYAAAIYPGGSRHDMASTGFDWIHNYWCNLLNVNAINGTLNTSQPYAIAAMIILCLGLMVFFVQFTESIARKPIWQKLIPATGILSMSFAIGVFTDYHDLMTTLSGIFGVVAVIGIISEIYDTHLRWFKWTGILCILILAVNNLIYYSQIGIYYLPLLQKITMVLVLSWVIGLTTKMNNTKGVIHSNC